MTEATGTLHTIPPLLERLFESIQRSRSSTRTRGLLRSAATGVAASGAIGLAYSWKLAALNIASVAGLMAYRLWLDHDEKGRLAAMDSPGGRRIVGTVLDQIDFGALGIARGNAWAVFETPDSAPRMMDNAEYDAFRRSVPHIVEIEVQKGLIGVGRYVKGVLDSSSTGKPAAEMYDRTGTRRLTDWYVAGRPTTMLAAMKAHQAFLAENEASTAPSP